MDPLTRVQQLIALAVDPGASESESKTAAVLACRAIREHKFRIAPEREPEMVVRPAPRRIKRRVMHSKYAGHCSICLKAYSPGALIAWAKDEPTVHARCWKSKTANQASAV